MKTRTASLLSCLALSVVAVVTTKAQAPARTVEVLDPALEAILSPDAVLKTVVPGTGFFEGPTWVSGQPGHLIFTDIPHNVINRLDPDGKATPIVDNIYIGDSDKADPRVLKIGAKGEMGKLTGGLDLPFKLPF